MSNSAQATQHLVVIETSGIQVLATTTAGRIVQEIHYLTMIRGEESTKTNTLPKRPSNDPRQRSTYG